MNTQLRDEDKVCLFNAMCTHECDALIRLDLLTGEAATIQASDPLWVRSMDMRYDFETILHRYILDHSVDSDSASILAALRIDCIGARLEEKNVYEVYVTFRGSDGGFELKAVSFYHTAHTQALVTIRDFTEAFSNMSARMTQLETAVKDAATELEERNAFLSLLSRNLRAPLHSIMGLTALAEDETEMAGVDSYLQKISMSGTYMRETIEDILDLRRISHGQIELHPERILLGGLFAQLHQLNKQTAQEHGLIYTEEYDTLSATAVMTDLHCMRQIILKLVQCSAGCASKGSRLHLRCREQYRTDSHTAVIITVDCRGTVLDQESIATMFRPYDPYRDHIDEQLSASDISTIILKSYCRSLGAKSITAESDETHGTRISVLLMLPLAEDQQGLASVPDLPAQVDFSGVRVLLVDDNAINLEVAAKVLRHRGVITTTATDGQEAVDLYRQANGACDLILMDLLMPGMDGIQAAMQIRGMTDIPGSDSIPIIALTANAFREDFKENLRSGFDAVLLKPVDADRMFGLMALLLHKEG